MYQRGINDNQDQGVTPHRILVCGSSMFLRHYADPTSQLATYLAALIGSLEDARVTVNCLAQRGRQNIVTAYCSAYLCLTHADDPLSHQFHLLFRPTSAEIIRLPKAYQIAVKN